MHTSACSDEQAASKRATFAVVELLVKMRTNTQIIINIKYLKKSDYK